MAFNTHSLDLELSSTQYAYIADASQTGLDITGDITIEAWVKTESTIPLNEVYTVVAKWGASGQQSYKLIEHFNGVSYYLQFQYTHDGSTFNSCQISSGSQYLTVGSWVHVASVFDASAASTEFFINGSSVGTNAATNTSIFNSTAPLAIGATYDGTTATKPFDGLIDEVRIWDDLRTVTEIANNMFIHDGFTVGVNNLIEIWHLDNDYTSISGNNNLTAVGSPVFSTDVATGFESASQSPSSSSSASLSPSASSSASNSASTSASSSRSESKSASSSNSASTSASPSSGYTGYTRGDELSLPTNDNDLETAYNAQDVVDVATDDAVRVAQTGTLQYMLHQFKNFVIEDSCVLTWNGQSTLAPSSSSVLLQIYNRNTTTWDTVTTNNSAGVNTDFNLSGGVSDLTNYKSVENVISCRVYQLAI